MKNCLELAIEKDEYWWSGCVDLSALTPMTAESEVRFDMLNTPYCNQLNPVFFSSKGRYAYLPEAGIFEVKNGKLILSSDGEIYSGQKATLKEAQRFLSQTYYPFTGKAPTKECFTSPQYCTWMELLYEQNQEEILSYARRLVADGMPAGEFIIDDGWEEYYGYWDFCKRKFPDAKKMCQELQALGFKVVLWVVPYVSPDSDIYRFLKDKDYLIKDENGKPFITEWWNGFSAVIDLSNPEAGAWFQAQFDYLKETYGISGWKMDGGDSRFYPTYPSGKGKISAYEHSELYASFGQGMEIKELRACVKNGGRAIVQRVADRRHNWDRVTGLSGLIEKMLVQGLVGYPYCCPDMVGGGLIEDYQEGTSFSKELYFRFIQASALMTSWQFSQMFWKNDPTLKEEVQRAIALRNSVASYIEELVENASKTGEPVMRSIAYEFNERPDINDEFLLGNQYLVAPVIEKGATEKRVYLPTGKWQYAKTGEIFNGGKEFVFPVGLKDLPYFIRLAE